MTKRTTTAPQPLRYTDWIKYVFDRPETDGNAWYFDFELVEFDANPSELVDLISYTFENCGQDLKSFNDTQLSQGFKFILENNCSDVVFAIMSNEVSLDARLRCIASIKILYADCFETRCMPVLGHLNQPGNPLNAICYMLWDVSPLSFWENALRSERSILYDAVVDVLEYALRLSNPACVESALHGLGHMLSNHNERISDVFDVLNRKNILSDQTLRFYAKQASTGYVQ